MIRYDSMQNTKRIILLVCCISAMLVACRAHLKAEDAALLRWPKPESYDRLIYLAARLPKQQFQQQRKLAAKRASEILRVDANQEKIALLRDYFEDFSIDQAKVLAIAGHARFAGASDFVLEMLVEAEETREVQKALILLHSLIQSSKTPDIATPKLNFKLRRSQRIKIWKSLARSNPSPKVCAASLLLAALSPDDGRPWSELLVRSQPATIVDQSKCIHEFMEVTPKQRWNLQADLVIIALLQAGTPELRRRVARNPKAQSILWRVLRPWALSEVLSAETRDAFSPTLTGKHIGLLSRHPKAIWNGLNVTGRTRLLSMLSNMPAQTATVFVRLGLGPLEPKQVVMAGLAALTKMPMALPKLLPSLKSLLSHPIPSLQLAALKLCAPHVHVEELLPLMSVQNPTLASIASQQHRKIEQRHQVLTEKVLRSKYTNQPMLVRWLLESEGGPNLVWQLLDSPTLAGDIKRTLLKELHRWPTLGQFQIGPALEKRLPMFRLEPNDQGQLWRCVSMTANGRQLILRRAHLSPYPATSVLIMMLDALGLPSETERKSLSSWPKWAAVLARKRLVAVDRDPLCRTDVAADLKQVQIEGLWSPADSMDRLKRWRHLISKLDVQEPVRLAKLLRASVACFPPSDTPEVRTAAAMTIFNTMGRIRAAFAELSGVSFLHVEECKKRPTISEIHSPKSPLINWVKQIDKTCRMRKIRSTTGKWWERGAPETEDWHAGTRSSTFWKCIPGPKHIDQVAAWRSMGFELKIRQMDTILVPLQKNKEWLSMGCERERNLIVTTDLKTLSALAIKLAPPATGALIRAWVNVHTSSGEMIHPPEPVEGARGAKRWLAVMDPLLTSSSVAPLPAVAPELTQAIAPWNKSLLTLNSCPKTLEPKRFSSLSNLKKHIAFFTTLQPKLQNKRAWSKLFAHAKAHVRCGKDRLIEMVKLQKVLKKVIGLAQKGRHADSQRLLLETTTIFGKGAAIAETKSTLATIREEQRERRLREELLSLKYKVQHSAKRCHAAMLKTTAAAKRHNQARGRERRRRDRIFIEYRNQFRSLKRSTRRAVDLMERKASEIGDHTAHASAASIQGAAYEKCLKHRWR